MIRIVAYYKIGTDVGPSRQVVSDDIKFGLVAFAITWLAGMISVIVSLLTR